MIDGDSYFKTFKSYLGNEFAAYMGTETSPPCNAGVKWFVAKKFRKITAKQVTENPMFQEKVGFKRTNVKNEYYIVPV